MDRLAVTVSNFSEIRMYPESKEFVLQHRSVSMAYFDVKDWLLKYYRDGRLIFAVESRKFVIFVAFGITSLKKNETS